MGDGIASKGTRLRQLDVLRGVAVVLVLGRHMGAVPTNVPFAIQTVLDLWVHVGWIGVDLFFVLSGFLVSGLLFREYARTGSVRVRRFLLRRALRIYPAFYVFLLSTSLLAGTVKTRAFLAEATFVQNYVPGLWDHTWSLAIEEHFYLLLVLLVAVLLRRRRSASPPVSPQVFPRGFLSGSDEICHPTDPFSGLVRIFWVVGASEIALRVAAALYAKPSFVHHLYPTHLRLDSLLVGVLLSYLAWSRGPALERSVRTHRPHLLLTSVVCLAPTFFLPPINGLMETLGFTLVYIGFGAVLLLCLYHGDMPPSGKAAARAPQPAARLGKRVLVALGRTAASTLAWIGVYSYSIYLWHLAVKQWAVPLVVRTLGWQPGGIIAFTIYLCASVAMGAAMARLIEIPTLALRDRWFPSPPATDREREVRAQLETPLAARVG